MKTVSYRHAWLCSTLQFICCGVSNSSIIPDSCEYYKFHRLLERDVYTVLSSIFLHCGSLTLLLLAINSPIAYCLNLAALAALTGAVFLLRLSFACLCTVFSWVEAFLLFSKKNLLSSTQIFITYNNSSCSWAAFQGGDGTETWRPHFSRIYTCTAYHPTFSMSNWT